MDKSRIKEALHDLRDLQRKAAGLERLLVGMIEDPPPAPKIKVESPYFSPPGRPQSRSK